MQYMSSTEIRNNFSKAIEMAQRAPVTIQKQGRDVAVVISTRDYERIRRNNAQEFFKLCDDISAQAAKNGLTEKKLAEILADTSND